MRVMRSRLGDLPLAKRIGSDGVEREAGEHMHYMTAPFRFCPACGQGVSA